MRKFVNSIILATLALSATSAVAGNAPVTLTRQPDASSILPVSNGVKQYYLANLRSNQLYRRVAALTGADPNGTENLTSPPFLLPDNSTRVQIIVAPDNRILEVLPVAQN